MKSLFEFSLRGFLIGVLVALITIFLHAVFVCFWPESLSYRNFSDPWKNLFGLFVWPLSLLEMNIEWNNLWVFTYFGKLTLANGILYGISFLFVGVFSSLFSAFKRKIHAVFCSKKTNALNSDKNKRKTLARHLIRISSMGFVAGTFVAIFFAATHAISFNFFFPGRIYSFIHNLFWDDIVLFLWPSSFATMLIREYNFDGFLFICMLIFMNGIRCALIFYFLGIFLIRSSFFRKKFS